MLGRKLKQGQDQRQLSSIGGGKAGGGGEWSRGGVRLATVEMVVTTEAGVGVVVVAGTAVEGCFRLYTQ